jgi:anti-anti-sigma factor
MNVEQLSIHVSADVGITVVKLVGELDVHTEPELRNVLKNLNGDVSLDCYGLEFLDSCSVRFLMRIHRAYAARGDRLTIRGLPKRCLRIVTIAGLDTVLHLEECSVIRPMCFDELMAAGSNAPSGGGES